MMEDERVEASPRQADFATPSMGFPERFDAQAEASNTPSEAAAAGLLVEEEQQQQQEERPASAAVRGSKPRGRGGSRGGSTAATASTRGRGGAGRGGRGSSSRGVGSRGGAANRARGGAATGKAGGRGGKASGSSNGGFGIDSGIGGIGSGPSNTIFPLARVSRIVKVDKEIEMTSKDAIWTTAVATELFIKHLTDSAFAKARLDKKKTVTYKELASAVESQSEFFFLQDVVPQPVSLARALELRQEIEERNHMREAGLVEDDDDLDGFALVNQTVGDETEEAKLKETLIDGEGDTAMEGQEPPSAIIADTAPVLANGATADWASDPGVADMAADAPQDDMQA